MDTHSDRDYQRCSQIQPLDMVVGLRMAGGRTTYHSCHHSASRSEDMCQSTNASLGLVIDATCWTKIHDRQRNRLKNCSYSWHLYHFFVELT